MFLSKPCDPGTQSTHPRRPTLGMCCSQLPHQLSGVQTFQVMMGILWDIQMMGK